MKATKIKRAYYYVDGIDGGVYHVTTRPHTRIVPVREIPAGFGANVPAGEAVALLTHLLHWGWRWDADARMYRAPEERA